MWSLVPCITCDVVNFNSHRQLLHLIWPIHVLLPGRGARSFEPYLNELGSFKQTREKWTSFKISSWFSRKLFPPKWSLLNAQQKEKKQRRKGKEEGRGLSKKLFRNYVFFECPNCFLTSGTKGLINVSRSFGSIFPDSDQKMGHLDFR